MAFVSKWWFKYPLLLIIIVLLVTGIRVLYENLGDIFLMKEDYQPDDFNDADKFVKYGYPEIKALSIQFLTLLSAILIFSITFSEKIIKYDTANWLIKGLLIGGWIFLIVAIISDGLGLAYNAFALPHALVDIHNFEKDGVYSAKFYEEAGWSLIHIIMAGVYFILALICIGISAVITLFSKRGAPATTGGWILSL